MSNVELFTQTGCVPCRAVKNKLVEYGIEHEVRNITNDPLALETVKNANIQGTPAMRVDDMWLRGAGAIMAWMKANRE